MYKDEIISEVWKNRQTYVERHHHDLARIIADLKERQKKSARLFVDRRKAIGSLQPTRKTVPVSANPGI